jgi:D-3-phosphoglycerate dehydrogenase
MEKIVIIDDETEIFSLKTEISKALNSLNREIDLYYSRPEDTAEIISRLKDTHTVIVTKATTKINNDVIENLPSLKHIAVFGTALDHIDENAAKRNEVVISSIPNSFTMSVAEHTMALMFSLIKKIPEINNRIKNNNEWPSEEVDLINGKTIGIIGSGLIGEQVAKMASSFGMHVIMSPVMRLDNSRIRTIEEFAEVSDINLLLENSDVISIHTKLTTETKHLIDNEEISKIKSNAIIINTARGSLINQSVLYDALITGKIAGAALDVFEKEPIEKNSPLKGLKNVLLTSHNGANSKELILESINNLLKNVKQNL